MDEKTYTRVHMKRVIVRGRGTQIVVIAVFLVAIILTVSQELKANDSTYQP